jgi:hypothetical protein
MSKVCFAAVFLLQFAPSAAEGARPTARACKNAAISCAFVAAFDACKERLRAARGEFNSRPGIGAC